MQLTIFVGNLVLAPGTWHLAPGVSLMAIKKGANVGPLYLAAVLDSY